jgi:hypothetical protein
VCHGRGEYARDEDGDGWAWGACQHDGGILVSMSARGYVPIEVFLKKSYPCI